MNNECKMLAQSVAAEVPPTLCSEGSYDPKLEVWVDDSGGPVADGTMTSPSLVITASRHWWNPFQDSHSDAPQKDC